MGLMKELNDLNNIYLKMSEGKATPESGTGKYYKEGQPTKQQLANRAKREKIKQLTNQGKHKEASALHNEDYETKKTKEVIGALDKEKPGKRRKPLTPSQKKEIAAKVVKDKGDTTKSDDRYAYEDFQPSEIVVKLVESGKFSIDELWKIVEVEEGYQRNPEKGEEEERKAEKRRKESGAMPPRGDKRREDFERWYAANVR
jgi:hypothetical protein